MKNLKINVFTNFFALNLVCGLLFIMVSCRYKEGPFLALESPEGRITGVWRVKKLTKDGIPFSVLKCTPDTFFNVSSPVHTYSLIDRPLFFHSDGQVEAGIELFPYCYYAGKWKLKDDKKIIEIAFDRNRDSVFFNPVLIELTIVRLFKKYHSVKDKANVEGDLRVEEKRKDGTYVYYFEAN